MVYIIIHFIINAGLVVNSVVVAYDILILQVIWFSYDKFVKIIVDIAVIVGSIESVGLLYVHFVTELLDFAVVFVVVRQW